MTRQTADVNADTAVRTTRDAVLRAVSAPTVPHMVRAYYDPDGTFAGLTFDTVGNNPADRFSTDDALAISLLDTALTPKAVRDLTEARADEFAELLALVPDPTVVLWEATDAHLDAANSLWRWLCDTINGVGPTRAGKILARKRPALIPIADEVTLRLFKAPSNGLWVTLRAVLADTEVRHTVEALRGDLPETVTTLRLLDTALWMTGSGSEAARTVRALAQAAVHTGD